MSFVKGPFAGLWLDGGTIKLKKTDIWILEQDRRQDGMHTALWARDLKIEIQTDDRL